MSQVVDLGSPLGFVDMGAHGTVDQYARWVGETMQGVASECGALSVAAACEDPDLEDLIQEAEAIGTI